MKIEKTIKITFFFFVSTLRRCPLGKLMGLWVRQAMAAFSSSKTTKPKFGTLFWLSVRFLLWATPLLLMRTSTTWKIKKIVKSWNIRKLVVFWRLLFQKPGIHRIFIWFRMKIIIIFKKIREIGKQSKWKYITWTWTWRFFFINVPFLHGKSVSRVKPFISWEWNFVQF